MLVFLNGKFVPEKKAVLSIFDRSFLYGDGLFETIRILGGKPFRWEPHFDRLQHGADFLKIKLPLAEPQLLGVVLKLIEKNQRPDGLLRLTLSRGVGAPGYSPKKAKHPALVMSLRPALERGNPPSWKLAVSSFRLSPDDPLARFKTCNKLPQVLARAEADAAGADEALLLNTRGSVVEGTSSNLFWIKRGILHTPPLAAGILPGVTRAIVFEIASQLQIPLLEKNISLAELPKAEGIFLSLTSLGIVEAASLAAKTLKRSALTGQIARAYHELLANSSACNGRAKT